MIGIMFIIFALFLALGIPIAFSVGWATLSVHLMNPAFTCDAEYFFKTMVNGMDSYVLLAIPLFDADYVPVRTERLSFGIELLLFRVNTD